MYSILFTHLPYISHFNLSLLRRDVQWNIAENRGSSSGASSREPPYSAGTAATTAAASAVAAARFNGM